MPGRLRREGACRHLHALQRAAIGMTSRSGTACLGIATPDPSCTRLSIALGRTLHGRQQRKARRESHTAARSHDLQTAKFDAAPTAGLSRSAVCVTTAFACALLARRQPAARLAAAMHQGPAGARPGPRRACTGFGLAAVVNHLFWVRHLGAERRRRSTGEPRMLYELARRYDEWQGDGYEGSSCRGALKGWPQHGVCADALWRYRGKEVTCACCGRRRLGRRRCLATARVYYASTQSVVDMQSRSSRSRGVCVARIHDAGIECRSRQGTALARRVAVIPPAADPRRPGATPCAGRLQRARLRGANSWGRPGERRALP